MVLVHGGGGTAFKEWVEKWNARGYAAISIAVEGQTDKRSEDGESWEKHEWAGPSRVGIYGDAKEEFKDQWMYHAVADTDSGALAAAFLTRGGCRQGGHHGHFLGWGDYQHGDWY